MNSNQSDNIKTIVIVGGVAGGASAAARARRLDEFAHIIVFERDHFISFANCGLPYHIGGEIESRESLLVQTPQSMKARFNLDIRIDTEVLSINKANKTVTVRESNGKEYTQAYDSLLLSPGAKPFIPPLPGVNHELVFSLRNIPDMDKIMQNIDERQPRSAVVIGGGFIGIEMAEALVHRGIGTSLVELQNQIMTPVDAEMATPLHREMKRHGVKLMMSAGVEAIEEIDEDNLSLTLTNGRKIVTEMVIMAVGVRPETSLAKQAGLELGSTGAILVNNHMQTSDEHIYAVGDAIQVKQFGTDLDVSIPLAGPANRQGRIAAENMLGRTTQYNGTLGTSVCKVFDMAVASVGRNEKQLQCTETDYQKVYVHPLDHAGYYPGANQISFKLLFDAQNGEIFGAQAVGKTGVEKRIDVISMAMKGKLSVFDLEEVELCYAPPFGSAKDVVNQAGFVASNVIRGDIAHCQAQSVHQCSDNMQIIDVRNPEEIGAIGAIEQSINIPLPQLRDRLGELDKDKNLVVYCAVGLRGYVAARLLQQHGFKVKNLSGGYKTWQMIKGIGQFNLK
jgi:NADPH-dependent 2,4-dienoyl-CoA reductase/sulfur reductase-like enzyme/rhodanese-related sulfurtransferase